MRVKYSSLSAFWKKALAENIFGKTDDCVASSLLAINPKVDEASLSIKIEDKNQVYLMVKKCREGAEIAAEE